MRKAISIVVVIILPLFIFAHKARILTDRQWDHLKGKVKFVAEVDSGVGFSDAGNETDSFVSEYTIEGELKRAIKFTIVDRKIIGKDSMVRRKNDAGRIDSETTFRNGLPICVVTYEYDENGMLVNGTVRALPDSSVIARMVYSCYKNGALFQVDLTRNDKRGDTTYFRSDSAMVLIEDSVARISETEFFFDKKGRMMMENVKLDGGRSTSIYRFYSCDSKGNWISQRRSMTEWNSSYQIIMTKPLYSSYRRHIEYY